METRGEEKGRNEVRREEEKAEGCLRGWREEEEEDGWKEPRGGRNFGRLFQGPAGYCLPPLQSSLPSRGLPFGGVNSAQEPASGMGEFVRARAPLKDLFYPVVGVLLPHRRNFGLESSSREKGRV